MKGKQKMVLQGVLKLLKSLIPLSLSSFHFLQIARWLPAILMLWWFSCATCSSVGCIFLMGLVRICQYMLSRTLCVKSCLVLAFQLGTLCSDCFFFNICWLLWDRIIIFFNLFFFFLLKMGVFRQICLRTKCRWVAFNSVWKWRNGYMTAIKGCKWKRSTVPL